MSDKMPEEVINGVKVRAVRVEEVYEMDTSKRFPKPKRLKDGYVKCPVWTSFDNGTWEDFLRVQFENKKKILSKMSEEERKKWGFEEFLTKEELEALAEYCWKHCRHWTGMDYMNDWVFLINDRKVVGFSFRGWGGFMSRVRHKFTGKRVGRWDYMDWYC